MKHKHKIRNKKGNVLIIEFVAILPLFFFLMLIFFDFLQLYTAVINNQLAAQAAMSEIAFMGQDGKEEYVVPTAVKKANAIISYATDKQQDSQAHQNYKYYLINKENGTERTLSHSMTTDNTFLVNGKKELADHRKEIWGFRIEGSYSFDNLSILDNSFTIHVKSSQYMGILKGIKS